MTRRTIDEIGDLLELPYTSVLSTWREDGTALLSPVWHEWRDDGFNVDVPAGDIKLRHLERDPHASLVVYDQSWPSRGFEVSGIAQIRPERDEPTSRRIAIRYLGPIAGAAYMAAAGPGIIVRLEPGRMRGWDFVEAVRPDPGHGIAAPVAPSNATGVDQDRGTR